MCGICMVYAPQCPSPCPWPPSTSWAWRAHTVAARRALQQWLSAPCPGCSSSISTLSPWPRCLTESCVRDKRVGADRPNSGSSAPKVVRPARCRNNEPRAGAMSSAWEGFHGSLAAEDGTGTGDRTEGAHHLPMLDFGLHNTQGEHPPFSLCIAPKGVDAALQCGESLMAVG
jgi:hypothetical protein